MKKLILIMAVVLIGSMQCHAAWDFLGIESLKKTVNDNSTKEFKLMDKVAEDVSAIKIGQLTIGDIQTCVEFSVRAEFKAQAAAQGQALAGVGNSQVNQAVGGNMVNSSPLMIAIFSDFTRIAIGLLVIMALLIFAILAMAGYSINLKTKVGSLTLYNNNLLASEERKNQLIKIYKEKVNETVV